jgi:hypothetical protein
MSQSKDKRPGKKKGSGRRRRWQKVLTTVVAIVIATVSLLAGIAQITDSDFVGGLFGRDRSRTAPSDRSGAVPTSIPTGTTPPTTTASSSTTGMPPTVTSHTSKTTTPGTGDTNPRPRPPSTGRLVVADTRFKVVGPWYLTATGRDNLPCYFTLLRDNGAWKYVKGLDILINVRGADTFEVDKAHDCALIVRHDGVGPVYSLANATLQVDRTSQGGATQVFRSTGQFTVIAEATTGCNAVAFRSSSGQKVTPQIPAGRPTSFQLSGDFWVESQSRDCTLTVRAGGV